MNAEEYSKRGDNYFSERNFDKAIEDFSETIKLEPDNPFAYYKRGLSYTNKKEFDLAISDFNAAIKIEPNKYGYFYFDRAGAYIFKGDKASAISDIETAIIIDPNNKDYHEALNDIKPARGNNSSGSENTKSVETIKKEIKVILIGAIIGAVVIAGVPIIKAIANYDVPSVLMIILGAWGGFGIGGNITFIPPLFKAGGFLLGWWNPVNTFYFNIICLLISAFIGYWIFAASSMAFILAGPIWPLVRILMKRNQIKRRNV